MVRELGDDVWWIDLGGVNAYLVDDGGTLTLVDAGMPWQSGDLVDGIVEAGFVLADLDRVLVTHYDLDHVGGLSRLEGLGATVYTGTDEAPLVAGDRRPGLGSRKRVLQTVAGLLQSDPEIEVVGLEDGESIGSFTVSDTPGHTDGHVAFVSDARNAAFVGDLVRESDGDLEPSPWFISEDVATVRESVRSLAERLPSVDILGMGHGVPFERRGAGRLSDLADSLPRPSP